MDIYKIYNMPIAYSVNEVPNDSAGEYSKRKLPAFRVEAELLSENPNRRERDEGY